MFIAVTVAGEAPGIALTLRSVLCICRNAPDNAATHIQAVFRGHLVRRSVSPSRLTGGRGDKGGYSESKLEPEDDGPGDASPPTAVSSVVVASGTAVSGAPSAVLQSLSASTAALREEKSRLKHELKAFDVDFKAKHGRQVCTW
jgi:hypothetical protein